MMILPVSLQIRRPILRTIRMQLLTIRQPHPLRIPLPLLMAEREQNAARVQIDRETQLGQKEIK